MPLDLNGVKINGMHHTRGSWRYHEKHGNCQVDKRSCDSKFYSWICKQRRDCRLGNRLDERRELDLLGFFETSKDSIARGLRGSVVAGELSK